MKNKLFWLIIFMGLCILIGGVLGITLHENTDVLIGEESVFATSFGICVGAEVSNKKQE